MEKDYILAEKLQKKYDEEQDKKRVVASPKKQPPLESLTHPDWELVDPNPNVYDLFQIFDNRFFWSKLGSVEVKWSPRMTSCAGVCTYKGRAGCVISLSTPLLKLRPRKDLIETLLHEMIHAYLFVTKNFKDRSDHGPEFHKHMNRINKEGGTKITVYHSFHDEVRHYQNHWWRCDGPCQSKGPYYGVVKRSMNRAPGPNDYWFAEHQATCGGNFNKIKEPEGYKGKKPKKLKTDDSSNSTLFSKGFVRGGGVGAGGMISNKSGTLLMKPKTADTKTNTKTLADTTTSVTVNVQHPITAFAGVGYTLGGSAVANDRTKSRLLQLGSPLSSTSKIQASASKTEARATKIQAGVSKNSQNSVCATFSQELDFCKYEELEFDSEPSTDDKMINCLVCNQRVKLADIDSHLENCKQLSHVFDNIIVIDDSDEEMDSVENDCVECPCCFEKVSAGKINEHLDSCLKPE